MNRGRYIISFVLVVALVAPFAAQMLVQQKINNNRYTMQQRMEKEPLVQLSIPENKLQWVKPGKEIRLGDRLFDIKKMNVENGMAHIAGLFDDEEKKLDKELGRQNQQNSSLQHLLVQLFSAGYDHSFCIQSLPPQVNSVHPLTKVYGIVPAYTSPAYDIAAPPPWLV